MYLGSATLVTSDVPRPCFRFASQMPCTRLPIAVFSAPAPRNVLGAAAPPTRPIFSQVDDILRTLSDITGWKVQRTVPAEILSKDNFRKMVEEGVKDAEGDKQTHAAEIALKMFGLVPQDFNLAQESGDLLAEQAAAFYDYKKKRLFVLDSTKADNEQTHRPGP